MNVHKMVYICSKCLEMKEGNTIGCIKNPDVDIATGFLCEKCYQIKRSSDRMTEIGF